MKKVFQAGTKDEQRTTADLSTSASVEANPMLSAALSVMDGNKLIAEFMGFISDKTNVYRVPNLFPFKGYESGYTEFYSWAIGFEKDWNMLMPVVEKISKIEYEKYEQDNGNEKYIEVETAFPRTFGMINSRTGNPMFRFNRCQCFEAPTLIEVTWLAVIDFIESENNVASVR